MIIPSAEILESSISVFKNTDSFTHIHQIKELETFGAERIKALGASGLTADFSAGYLFGLCVLRYMLSINTAILLSNVDKKYLP